MKHSGSDHVRPVSIMSSTCGIRSLSSSVFLTELFILHQAKPTTNTLLVILAESMEQVWLHWRARVLHNVITTCPYSAMLGFLEDRWWSTKVERAHQQSKIRVFSLARQNVLSQMTVPSNKLTSAMHLLKKDMLKLIDSRRTCPYASFTNLNLLIALNNNFSKPVDPHLIVFSLGALERHHKKANFVFVEYIKQTT